MNTAPPRNGTSAPFTSATTPAQRPFSMMSDRPRAPRTTFSPRSPRRLSSSCSSTSPERPSQSSPGRLQRPLVILRPAGAHEARALVLQPADHAAAFAGHDLRELRLHEAAGGLEDLRLEGRLVLGDVLEADVERAARVARVAQVLG